MANDIRQKIVLDGEKEYNAALKEAQRNLKVLRSELKAETAELGKNATEQQKNETRTKNLQKQIKEQEKIVRAYEKALGEVREKYGDNEEAVAKWEIKLNDARTALANLKNGLNDLDKGFDKTSNALAGSATEAKSFADSLGKIAEVGNSIADGIENVFKGIAGTIRSTVGDIWGDLMDLAGRADNWLDLSQYLNTSAVNVQKWERSLESAGHSMGEITSLVSKLRFGGADDKLTNWFNVSGTEYMDDLKYMNVVLSEMAAHRQEMLQAGTWDTAMADIFGAKRPEQIEMLLADWEQIQSLMQDYNPDEGGYGNTEEEIQTLGELNDAVAKLKGNWKALKDMATVKLFGNLALDITSNVQGILDAFKTYINAGTPEEREQALQDIEKNITEIFNRIGMAIQAGMEALSAVAEELKKSDNPVVKTIGEVIGGLMTALEWIVNNQDKVKIALIAIFSMSVLARIASFASTLASIAANLTLISAAKGGSGLLSMGAAGSAGSVLLPVALAAITCGPLLYELIHGHDETKANEAAQTFENINAALNGREAQEGVTVNPIGDFFTGKRSFGAWAGDLWANVKQNAGTGEGSSAFYKGLGSLLSGKNEFKDDQWRREYTEMTEMGVYQSDLNALLLARTNMNDENPIRTGANNKYKYEETVFKMLDTLRETFSEDEFWRMLWDDNLMMSMINGRYNTKNPNDYGAMYEKMAREWLEQDNTRRRWQLIGEQAQNDTSNDDQIVKVRRGKIVRDPGETSAVDADWWLNPRGNNAQNTQVEIHAMREDINKLPASIFNGLSNVRVYLDGDAVGQLLTQRISEGIARQVQ